jgi:ADP-ribosyl-[dinitrogen reductase] hydrolase
MMMRSVRTSLSHPLRIDELSIDGVNGFLGLTLCPGKTDPYGLTASWKRDLAADMDIIVEWGASVVVSLIEDNEFDLLQVSDLGPAVERAGMIWYHLPIKDITAPGDAFERRWTEKGEEIKDSLSAGGKVLLHCRGGLGRTGTVAAKILVEFGYTPDVAIEAVRRARPGAIENSVQERYVYSCGSPDCNE